MAQFSNYAAAVPYRPVPFRYWPAPFRSYPGEALDTVVKALDVLVEVLLALVWVLGALVSGLDTLVGVTKARGGNYNKKQHIVYLFVVITPDVFGAAVGAFST